MRVWEVMEVTKIGLNNKKNMKYKVIYWKLQSKAFEKVYFSKEFLLVKKEHFIKYKKYFIKEDYKNIFNSWINYRTKESFYHIHLVEYDDFIQVHIDLWNMYSYKILWILHFLIDVIPYHIILIFKWKNSLKERVLKHWNNW